MTITNEEFLKTLFGDDHIWAHVCSFMDDPSDIKGDRRFACWRGNYYSRTSLIPESNQYFTISTFYADDKGKARRRKALFRATHVIVADDVREKLPEENVLRLPPPTYKLETSPGSEQWGWVLDQPCQDRHRVENLLDGLVAQGLAPYGKDPGMKGVTRYVRLPEGCNTKSSRVHSNGGKAPGCCIVEWSPWNRTRLEDLAAPFEVDLDAERREGRVDGAADVPDHPLLGLDIIEVKSVRSDGRFDITCPWVDEHTGATDDGAAVFTNNDGSIGFKCHHGACQHRTGGDLLRFIEDEQPGFRQRLDMWKLMRVFGDVGVSAAGIQSSQRSGEVLSFLEPVNNTVTSGEATLVRVDDKAGEVTDDYQKMIDMLKGMDPTARETINFAYEILKILETLDPGYAMTWTKLVCDHMVWSKGDLVKVLRHLRDQWYAKPKPEDYEELENFYDTHIFISEQNMFFSPSKRMWLSPEGFHNTFSHIDEDARAQALTSGKVQKVDRLDYAPGMPQIFVENGITYANGWSGKIESGEPGDPTRWLKHFDVLGWGEHKKHLTQWMAFTLLHPERKINHMLILGGGEGNGKDFLLYPLHQALRHDATTIDGDVLLSSFQEYLLSTKYLHINESELGDRKEAKQIANRAKPLAAAPPNFLRVNLKGIKPVLIRNIVNCTMTSNSAVPMSLSGDTRRYYAVWTNVRIRGADGQVTKEWQEYWEDRWHWMRSGGWKACVWYLMNCVDLSDFNAGSPPVVTDFVKEIQEASEDPISSVLKEMIINRHGLFVSDLLTVRDIHAALNTANMFGFELGKLPSPNTIGKIMKQNAIGISYRGRSDDGQDVRVWGVRNLPVYDTLDSKSICDEYLRQIGNARSAVPLRVVGEGGA